MPVLQQLVLVVRNQRLMMRLLDVVCRQWVLVTVSVVVVVVVVVIVIALFVVVHRKSLLVVVACD